MTTYIILELSEKGSLIPGLAQQRAAQFMKLHGTFPQAEFHICLGGFGEDPRELWDIPEARSFISTFAEAVFKAGLKHFRDWRIDRQSKVAIAMCTGRGEILYQEANGGHWVKVFEEDC